MEIMQKGTRVHVDSKGNKTRTPMGDTPAPSRKRTPMAIGEGNERNRAAREAAGMKRGGAVKKPGKGRYC